MYTNGSYALVQLVTGQAITIITDRRLVALVMVQVKNNIEKKIISTYCPEAKAPALRAGYPRFES